MNWSILAEKALAGEEIARAEAQAVLDCPDESLLALIDAAYAVRRAHFGKRVKLNFLLNAKSGLCPEDCNYCSQSKVSEAGIEKYPFLSKEEIVAAAERAVSTKAKRFCMVNSGRGPTDGEIGQIEAAVTEVKGRFPQLEICVCAGILQDGQAERLKTCGVDAYNHNLNTSANYYSDICSTHTYEDRARTVETAKQAGLSSCSGALFGMGEKDKDIVDLAFTFRRMKVESVPVNFLIPIQGTPLESVNKLTPQRCLKILCLFRLVNPASELRIAGGREVHLRWLQPFGLFVANSVFIGDYLTTQGQRPEADLAMIRDLGFEVEGAEGGEVQQALPAGPEEFSVRLKG